MQAVQAVWRTRVTVPSGSRLAARTPDGKLVLFVDVDKKIRGVVDYSKPGMVPNEAELKKAVEYNYVFQTYDDMPGLEHAPEFEQLEALAETQ